MKKLSGGINHHLNTPNSHHYYTLNNDPKQNKSITKRPISRASSSSKSLKGISLAKNIKKSFEDLYFGVPVKQEANIPQERSKIVKSPLIYRSTKTIIERPRRIQPVIQRKIQYHYPVQYQIFRPSPVPVKSSCQSSSQTELGLSSCINKHSEYLSTAINSNEEKLSRCHSEQMLNNCQPLIQKPTSALQNYIKKSQQKRLHHQMSQISLGRTPMIESIYVQSSTLDEYLKKNKLKNMASMEKKK